MGRERGERYTDYMKYLWKIKNEYFVKVYCYLSAGDRRLVGETRAFDRRGTTEQNALVRRIPTDVPSAESQLVDDVEQ